MIFLGFLIKNHLLMLMAPFYVCKFMEIHNHFFKIYIINIYFNIFQKIG
jgi:hypothetical protein